MPIPSILIIDDDPVSIQAFKNCCSQAGVNYRVHVPTDGDQVYGEQYQNGSELRLQSDQEAGQEIMQRKMAEKALLNQNLLMSAIINSSHNLIIFALNRQYEYILFNDLHRQEMRKVWGVEIQNGMNLLNLMNIPELRDFAKKSVDRALAGEAFSEIQHQPGLDVYYEFSWNPIWSEDTQEVTGAAVFIRDTTERMRTEQTMKQQVEELQRWHSITLDREMRVLELKNEVNVLLAQLAQPFRYLDNSGETSIETLKDR